MLPARRKYLLSFQGEMKNKEIVTHPSNIDDSDLYKEHTELGKFIIEHLKDLAKTDTADKYVNKTSFGCHTGIKRFYPLRELAVRE